jgi:dephospho-CoA kinase
MVVGITGGIGSGKTTVVDLFKKQGDIAVYIADFEAKKLMVESNVIKENIIKNFGNESYIDGELNRPHISKIVFSDKSKLALLNSIVHPEVFQHFDNFIKKNFHKEYILYENAILFENGSDKMCDIIITVIANHDLKIERVMKRDSCSKDAVLARMSHQWNDSKKALLSNYIIVNDTLSATETQIITIHNILTKK